MNSKSTLLAFAFLATSPLIIASTEVSSTFIGDYKLISSQEGSCAESLNVKEGRGTTYSLWVTYRDENIQFLGNEKFEDINGPRQSETDSCLTAGPVIPFCVETRKEVTKFDKNKKVLENFYGKKSNYSTTARYKYSKLEIVNDGLKVTKLEMEKPMAPGVFSFTSVEVGATSRSFSPFAKTKEYSICTYSKL